MPGSVAVIPRVSLPRERRMITLEVRRCQPVSPGFTAVTLGGPGIRHLVPGGPDQAVRLFFPRKGQTEVRMPTASNEAWMAQVLLMPKSVRPWVRNLTIRSLRPVEQELDIEFALHGDSPMTSWVRRVRPGDRAGIFDLGSMYRPPEHARGRLLVGDESALPAILSILDSDPSPPPTEVFVEVARAHDIRSLPVPPGVRVHWLSRDGEDLRPGVRALQAVGDTGLPEGLLYAWVAGESRLATSVRRHLVNDRSVPRRDVSFYGYWRLGRSAPS
ncbi:MULTISPECIES: siderophore-interacting protein [unclassified Streptomyces]|uniref:siderophore-interacting protein n=1 Tax=unclassified Streptomyces TaxID=2593676 RepID=UPI0003601B92|nr:MULTISPECIES: siderophore-interacting protein [unclassified Streptomyces]MYQ82020.1 SIP domain-containing protein [Streptomyces sp. SID4923]